MPPSRVKFGRAQPHRPRREPDEEGASLRLVVGLQPVRELIRTRRAEVDRIAVDSKSSVQLEALARFATDQGVGRVERLDRGELDRISKGVSHQGVLAWAPPLKLLDVGELLGRPDLLGIVLDGIEDPQNFGAVVRSAVALARAPVFWGEHSAAPLSPATFRASAGAIEHAELCRVSSLKSLLIDAHGRGVAVIGLDPNAEPLLATRDLRGPTLLVVGSEHAGLSRGVRSSCSVLARLAEPGAVDSLNASVAAGIALYECVIQRNLSRG